MAKRAFDLIFSGLVVFILSPFFLLIAIAIILESKGGPMYLQPRVGLHNRDFYVFKFRTMRVGSDAKGLLTVGARDARITRVGYVLRKLKLDELPQFLNVLMGHMSVVGPRPEVRKYVKYYNPRQMKVLSVRPGITDYASIKYFDENALLAKAENPQRTYVEEIMPAKLEINLKYISEMSLATDLKIIFKTGFRILSRKRD